MKGMELPLAACARGKRALLCARCLLGVEKVGRVWVKLGEVKEVKVVMEVEEVRERAEGWMGEEICGFGEDNMKDSSTKLARE
jgi:hypothetical protein